MGALKPEKGIEPLTCSLRVSCSTPELIWRALIRLINNRLFVNRKMENQIMEPSVTIWK